MTNHPTPDGSPAWRGSGREGWGREEDEFAEKMAGPVPGDWYTKACTGAGIIGLVLAVAIFVIFTSAAWVGWALPFLVSPWGIGIFAVCVISLLAAMFGLGGLK